MIVYKINNDVNNFQYFLTKDSKDVFSMAFDCTSRGREWDPPSVYIYKPLHQEGDFFQFDSSSLIFREKILNRMHRFFAPAGEMLPLPFQGEMFYVLNVTNCINCLDPKKSEWATSNDGMKLYPTKFCFFKDRFSEAEIFKIPEDRGSILVVANRVDPYDEFVSAYQEQGLKGLIFEKIWEG